MKLLKKKWLYVILPVVAIIISVGIFFGAMGLNSNGGFNSMPDLEQVVTKGENSSSTLETKKYSISGCEFYDSTGFLKIASNEVVTVSNCVFSGATQNAILINGGQLDLINSKIVDCDAGQINTNGIALQINCATVNVINTTIQNNKTKLGSIVEASGQSTITFKNDSEILTSDAVSSSTTISSCIAVNTIKVAGDSSVCNFNNLTLSDNVSIKEEIEASGGTFNFRDVEFVNGSEIFQANVKVGANANIYRQIQFRPIVYDYDLDEGWIEYPIEKVLEGSTALSSINSANLSTDPMPVSGEDCNGWFIDRDFLLPFDSNNSMTLSVTQNPMTGESDYIEIYTMKVTDEMKSVLDVTKDSFNNYVVSLNDANANLATLAIPQVINSSYVTKIAYSGFTNMSNVSTIVLPAGLQEIPERAFYGASNLVGINLHNNIETIGYEAFYTCMNLSNIYQVYDEFIKDCKLNSIGTRAFSQTRIQSINLDLPNLTTINSFAFANCNYLESITIPKSVTMIGEGAFSNTKVLEEINFDANLTSFGSNIFDGVGSETGGTVINFGENIKTISGGFFNYNSNVPNITSVNFAENSSLTSVESNSFSYLDNLTSLGFPEGVTYIGFCSGMDNLTNLYIPDSVTNLSLGCFSDCEKLENVRLSQNMTQIPDGLFSGCSSLTTIELPESITTIGSEAFHGCNELSNINLPEGLTSIKQAAFKECTSLNSIDFPSTLHEIAYEAFKESGLVSVTIPENVVEIDYDAFDTCYSLEYIDYRAKNAVSSTGGYIFDTKDGSYLNIGYEVESLPVYAFAENVWGEVNFEVNPGTGECALIEISEGCFEYCNSEGDPLDITLPYGLESVGMNAFCNTYLGDVVLPLTITSLQDNAFHTEYLKYIVLPESLQEFGNDVFYSGALNAIHVGTETNAMLESNGYRLQEYCQNLYVDKMIDYAQDYISNYMNGGYSNLNFDFEIYSSTDLVSGVVYQTIGLSGINVNYENNDYNHLIIPNINGRLVRFGKYNDYTLDENYEYASGAVDYDPDGDGGYLDNIIMITLPDGIKYISSSAFKNFTNLRAANIPKYAEIVGNTIFLGLEYLQEIYYEAVNADTMFIYNNGDYWNMIDNYGGWGVNLEQFEIYVTAGVKNIPDAFIFNYDYAGDYNFGYVNNVIFSPYEQIVCEEFKNNEEGIEGSYSGLYLFPYSKVENIGANAFCADAIDYTTIIGLDASFPETFVKTRIKYFGSNAFDNMNLSNVADDFFKYAEVFDDYAFENATIPTHIVFGDDLISVSDYAFAAKDITSIDFGNSLETIGVGAFQANYLTEINLPNTLTTIGNYAFDSQDITSLILPDSVTSIGNNAFATLPLTSIVLSKNLRTIGSHAFEGLTGGTIEYLEIPHSVQTIGLSAFDGTNIKYIRFSNNLKTIGEYAFRNNTALEKVMIPGSSLTSIGDSAFRGCTALKNIVLPDSVESVGASAFRGCTALNSVVLPKFISEISAYTFYDCTSLSTIELAGYSLISESAFENCSSLVSICIPESVMEIKSSAFKNCNSLTDVIFDYTMQVEPIKYYSSLDKIGAQAFYNCNIGSIVLPSMLTQIGDEAFYNNPHLTYVKWVCEPNSTEVGERTLGGNIWGRCENLKYVYMPDIQMLPEDSPIDTEGSIDVSQVHFISSDNNVNSSWSNFDIEFLFDWDVLSFDSLLIGNTLIGSDGRPENVTDIFNLNYVTMDNGDEGYIIESVDVSDVGDSIVIPEIVSFIADGAFAELISYSKNHIDYLYIPSSVKYIGQNAFAGLIIDRLTFAAKLDEDLMSYDTSNMPFNSSSIFTVYICDNVTWIPDYFFYLQDGGTIDQVVFAPGSLCERLGAWSLNSASEVYLPNILTQIGSDALSGDIYSNSTDWNNNNENTEYAPISFPSSLNYLDSGAFSSSQIYGGIDLSACGNINNLTNIFSSADIHGVLRLPAQLDTIGRSEFSGSHITELDLSACTDLTILRGAFSSCESLTTIRFPRDMTSTNLTIGQEAFHGCTSLTNLILPETVQSLTIDSNAFYGCNTLTQVNFPKGNVSIGISSFEKCSALKIVSFEEGLTSIGARAFSYTVIESITIPDSCTTLGASAFYDCEKLVTAIIGEGITSIGSQAFQHCSALENVTLLNGLQSIGDASFSSTKIKSIVLPESLLSIGVNSFNNSLLTSIFIPKNVATIGENPFWKCASLEKIVVAKNNATFSDCESNVLVNMLTNTLISGCKNSVIPDSIINFGDSCLSYVSGITSIVNTNEGVTIGDYAFDSMPDLETVVVTGLTSMESEVFYGVKKLKNVYLAGDITVMGEHMFMNCNSLESVVLPNSITNFGYNCFVSCSSLAHFVVPDSVTKIEALAFSGTALKTMYIPSGVTYIDNQSLSSYYLEYIYYNATNVTTTFATTHGPFWDAGRASDGFEIVIGKDVTHIPENFMNNNSGANGYATIITFEDGSICNSIGKNAFANLFNLKEINYGIVSYTGTLDSASNIFGGDMTGSNNNGEFGVKIRISDSVKTLPNYLFYDLQCATTIEFAAINMNNFTGAHSIFYRFGESMFSLDDVTVKVVIKKNVSHIPNYLFATQGVNCIEEIYFESDTKCATIGSYAFADLGELKTVSLANGVETIGSYAFASNNLTNKIEELVLPETVNTISSYAFNKCTSLKKIYIASKNLYAIYEFAFNDCWNNLKIGFNGTKEDISDALKQYWNCFYNNGDPDPMYLEHTSYFFGISLDQFNELVDELLG